MDFAVEPLYNKHLRPTTCSNVKVASFKGNNFYVFFFYCVFNSWEKFHYALQKLASSLTNGVL